LVYSIHDSTTEVAIQRMIDVSQRMIDVQSQIGGDGKEGWDINSVMKRHLEEVVGRVGVEPTTPAMSRLKGSR
jgi:hypothetical protein